VPIPEVWIAEDNADVRLLLARAFRQLNAPLLPVFLKDGAELVEHFRSHQTSIPKLFLVDLQMPVMSGLDALKVLRRQGCCVGSPVVIFSSLEDPSTIEAAFHAGAKLYLKKPERLEGYADVARLCARCADTLRELPPTAIPVEAMDVQSALTLMANCEAEVSIRQR
jgi:CheY-like chemotaxis protein